MSVSLDNGGFWWMASNADRLCRCARRHTKVFDRRDMAVRISRCKWRNNRHFDTSIGATLTEFVADNANCEYGHVRTNSSGRRDMLYLFVVKLQQLYFSTSSSSPNWRRKSCRKSCRKTCYSTWTVRIPFVVWHFGNRYFEGPCCISEHYTQAFTRVWDICKFCLDRFTRWRAGCHNL